MTGDLTSWVSARLDADARLSGDAKLLILAALEGERSLAEMAGRTPPASPAGTGEEAEPAGAFLKQIKVRGFRGIGPESRLDLDPFPSLTVISGRNGSGKSSFAEALEVALTGTSYRWHARASQWKERWRNIHDGNPARIDVTLAEEGSGATILSVEWPPESALDGMVTSLQRQGEKKQAGTASLGWAGPLETYRPLLTYEELGAVLTAEPKVLYDAISTVLGLEQLTRAVKALDEHRKEVVAPQTDLRNQKNALVQSMQSIVDERATRAAALLTARVLDLGALRRLATGAVTDMGVGVQLRAILMLILPGVEECESAASRLKAAVGSLAHAGSRLGEAVQGRSDLLSAAIAVHEHEGDVPCPVCGGGILDEARVTALRAELQADIEQLSALQRAREEYAAAFDAARALVSPTPSRLAIDTPVLASGLVDAAVAAWDAWADAPSDPLALCEHLTKHAPPARDALAALQAAAEAAANGLDEVWSRVATHLATFADAAEACEAVRSKVATATAAHKWLKDNEIILKNERVKPIAGEAKRIWAGLRQESNVEIAGLTLESSNTRRHVVISAEVDGEDAGALAEMSQGELHSLALALFLPRATLSESPFRFVVLDDPVQAMDPAKVDGLAKVLLEIARSRQVVVFSHDDRFASAVRRAPRNVPVKVLEIVREANSRVTPVLAFSPADRYLRDAFGLVKDGGLPEETRRRVLPGLLRMALEAQARESFFARELSRGSPNELVENAWEGAQRTRDRLALAIGDRMRIEVWLERANYRKWALRHANSIHGKLEHGHAMDACRDVERTVTDIRTGAT